jgi:hypothetical protein
LEPPVKRIPGVRRTVLKDESLFIDCSEGLRGREYVRFSDLMVGEDLTKVRAVSLFGVQIS